MYQENYEQKYIAASVGGAIGCVLLGLLSFFIGRATANLFRIADLFGINRELVILFIAIECAIIGCSVGEAIGCWVALSSLRYRYNSQTTILVFALTFVCLQLFGFQIFQNVVLLVGMPFSLPLLSLFLVNSCLKR